MPNLLATKPLSLLTLEATEQGEHTLKRSLGPIHLLALGIGAIILVTCSAFYLMLKLPLLTWSVLFIWLALGLVIYFGYSAKHSKVQKMNGRW